jgi:hypothetical protein
MKKLAALLILAAPALASADSPSATASTSLAEPTRFVLKEVGLTLGTPAGLNLNLGFWGTESIPLLVRASGMYYGSLKGFQGDLGLVSNGSGFRPFVAASFVTTKIDTSTDYLSYTGIGPTVGFNAGGLLLQGGLAFGISDSNYSWSARDDYGALGGGRRLGKAITLQIGYTILW